MNTALIFHRITNKEILYYEDISEDKLSFMLNEIHGSCRSLEQINNSNSTDNFWLLTFDDGFSSDFEIVLPLMKKFKVKALFFITTAFVGKPNYMTWDQIRTISNNGMDIGSHSVNHQDMLSLPKPDRINELETSRKIIEEQISKSIKAFSFPFGRFNAKLGDEVFHTGYEYCFTSKPGFFNAQDKLLPRISVNESMSKGEIQSILKKDNIKHLKNILLYNIRDLAKYCLGIENYWRVREFINNKKIQYN